MDFSILIQKWYRQNYRKLPWRSTKNPYEIWLSEIILQQTRVDQGLPYYEKFTNKYPTVQDLASASEKDVLNAWQGLGYYSRARNLHATAKYIASNLKGKFPNSYTEILSLKGVGEYTAAAIASFAFNLPHAVVDGNVYRVLSRVFAIKSPIDSTQGKKAFFELANQLIDKKNPGLHNQAIMELGSLVCKPSQPDCENCPLKELCLSYESKTQTSYPVKIGKTKITKRYFHYLILRKDENLIIRKRTDKDVWHGLYDFRLIEENLSDEELMSKLKSIKLTSVIKDGSFKHILSHQQIFATFWVLDVKKLIPAKDEIIVAKHDLDEYPMPRLLIRYLESSNYL